MIFQNFPPSLLTLSPRVTITGDPSASVAGINTTTVADGAWCYCIENRSEYQLDRQDTTAPDGNAVIAPLAGPGRWLKRSFAAAVRGSGTVQVTKIGTNKFATSGAAINFQVVTGSDFAYAGSTDFVLTAAGSVLTYNGSGGDYLVLLGCGVEDPTGGTPLGVFAIGVALNNDLVGTSSETDASVSKGGMFGEVVILQGNSSAASQRRVTLAPGDTLRPVGAAHTGDRDLVIDTLSLSPTPV